MNLRNITLILFVLFLTSCRTTDNVSYFQNIDMLEAAQINSDNANYQTKIKPDDQLSIFVTSIDPAAVAMFNLPLTSYQGLGDLNSGSSSTQVSTAPSLQTYLVDSKGDIDFPILDRKSVV